MTIAPVKPSKASDKPEPEDEEPGAKFNPNDYAWQDHLKRALEDLKYKSLEIERCWKYYDGDHPKVWLTEGIRKKLDEELITNMAENWCDTAVDAPVKRLAVEGFTVDLGSTTDEEGNRDTDAKDSISAEQAQNVFDDNFMKLGQKELYTTSRCVGEAYLGVWSDDDMEFGYRFSIMKPENIWWPEDSHRSRPKRVIQVWADEDDGVWRATCYYKYVVVRLVGPQLRDGGGQYMPQARYFKPDPDDPGGLHGFEYPPVFRFARDKKRRALIDQIRTIQDKINKLAANLLVNAEFNAWRKTILMTTQTIEDGDLEFRPNRILKLDPGGGEDGVAPTSVWEGSATELRNYSDEQDKLIDKLFTKSCLPGHLKVKAERAVPSGAAYEADEGPFTEDIIDQQDAYGETWIDIYKVILDIDVNVQWRNPHIKSDKDEVETVKIAKDCGVPLELALKKYGGWTEPELKELEEAPLSTGEQMQMALTQNLVNGVGGDNSGAVPGQAPKATQSAGAQPGKPGSGGQPVAKPQVGAPSVPPKR
jgi:hypothetical protein